MAQLIDVAGFQFEIPVPVVTFFVLFGRVVTNVILMAAFQMFCLHGAHQCLVTLAFGCGLCSSSFPGGHQVDGLPPASSAM